MCGLTDLTICDRLNTRNNKYEETNGEMGQIRQSVAELESAVEATFWEKISNLWIAFLFLLFTIFN